MANSADVDKSIYYVPESGWYPVFLAFGLMLTVTGLAGWLNDVSAGGTGDATQSTIGFAIVALVLYSWFAVLKKTPQVCTTNRFKEDMFVVCDGSYSQK